MVPKGQRLLRLSCRPSSKFRGVETFALSLVFPRLDSAGIGCTDCGQVLRRRMESVWNEDRTRRYYFKHYRHPIQSSSWAFRVVGFVYCYKNVLGCSTTNKPSRRHGILSL